MIYSLTMFNSELLRILYKFGLSKNYQNMLKFLISISADSGKEPVPLAQPGTCPRH